MDESLVTQREMHGHLRGYLDFIAEFLEGALDDQVEVIEMDEVEEEKVGETKLAG